MNKFTTADYEALKLLPVNTDLLNRTAEDKYNDFAGKDPFPDIPDSLLNSSDIIKYVLTTGMIDPFISENLTGATYTCDFSGRYVYWNDEKIQQKKELNIGEELILPPNSITFLEITPIFRIPLYMVLRFNLQVRNVYKGLLLGTGPIVDPGFVGKLFIPLHNLTSNEYIIKKNAHLISIEFTKLSKNPEWKINPKTIGALNIKKLNFSTIPFIPESIIANRDIDEYISKALQKNPDFCKKDSQEIYVNSSMQALKKDTSEAISSMQNIREDVEKSFEKLEHREAFFRNLFILSVIGIMISVVVLLIAAGWYFSKATELSEATQKIKYQQEQYEQDKTENQQIISGLEQRIINIESCSNP